MSAAVVGGSLAEEHALAAIEARHTHELKLNYQKYLWRGLFIAAGIHFLFLGTTMAISEFKKRPQAPPRIVRVKMTDIAAPPSLAKAPAAPQIPVQQQVAAPKVGAVKPVPIEKVLDVEQTIATQEEISASTVGSLAGMGGGNDSLVIDEGAIEEFFPSPEDYVAVEELPQLVVPPAPEYPKIAQEAGVEGQVLLLVLVGKDGQVKEVRVQKGIPMLNDSAVQAAKKASFKPALQNNKPVAVWVALPIKFFLRK